MASSSSGSPPGRVDQNTYRRRGAGLTAHDPARAFQGYTLFTPMFGDGTVFLIDMEGRPAHQWKMPLPPGLWAYRLDNGNLLYVGKTPDPSPPFMAWSLFKGGAVMEVDWDGNVLWEVRHPAQHHDARLLRNGNVIMLCLEQVPPEIAARVRGGLPGTEAPGGVMYADVIREVTKDGETVWEWRTWEHLDQETDAITATDHREEWTHGNTVVELLDGDVMISLRNISTVLIIDRATGAIRWRVGHDLLAQQHDPTLLPNDNVLVFDNGVRRAKQPWTFSRVIEIERESKRIVWQYTDRPLFNFYSPYISGAQRLPNGNTLITEGAPGRLFEVTAEGQVVWEYVSPYFGEAPALGECNWVFRARRYPAEAWPRLG